MPAFYLLDVAEFASILRHAETDDALTVSQSGAYYRIQSDADIVIPRDKTDLGEAVWFGALVAGFEGRLIEFSDTLLHIGKEVS